MVRKAIHLELTTACQLNCSYCYADKSGQELPVQAWLDVVHSCAPLTQQFTLGGGEPLLYRGLSPVIDAIHALGLPVSLTTNGLAVPKQMDTLQAVDLVSVSFHGDLAVVEQALASLASAGVPRSLNFLALDIYFPVFVRGVELAQRYGAALVLLAPKGVVATRLLDYFSQAYNAHRRGLKVGLDGLCFGQCHAGGGFFSINAQGRPMQCSFVREIWEPGGTVKSFGCLSKAPGGLAVNL